MTLAEKHDWPPIAVQLLLAVCRLTTTGNSPVRYAPAEWLGQRPTPKLQQRWSRWTRRLATAGLLLRITEPARDRVTHLRVTTLGRRWVRKHCGPGALD